ncbi:ATP synthase E chain-domain-containing protein [Chaetomidium leptoderma]|uniref:ATP synthase F(0) complex subunit e, mitochondrial n=1 Tax=Chaetomidium leptoderma TaxID=669021 RepID=A0AAN6VSN7_9PEZI|nr:ATP synthase E chain-domain-containing protein [Chaetomidium leptoderma]
MSSKSGVNVLRYSALGLGVFYGFYHQRTINSTQQTAAAQREYEHKQQLINKAKEAYAKSKQPASASTSATSGLNQDLNSPNFDLEAFFEGVMNAK